MAARTKRHDPILREAQRLAHWNKRHLNKQVRHSECWPSGKSGYKKTGYDSRHHTMA